MILSREQIMKLNAKEFAEKTREILDELQAILPALVRNPSDAGSIQKIYRGMAAFRGAGSMFGFDEVAALAQAVMRAFEPARNGDEAVSPALISLTLEAGEQIRQMVENTARASERMELGLEDEDPDDLTLLADLEKAKTLILQLTTTAHLH